MQVDGRSWSFAAWRSAAVAQLPAACLATGSAIAAGLALALGRVRALDTSGVPLEAPA
jgi:hypothetical protein